MIVAGVDPSLTGTGIAVVASSAPHSLMTRTVGTTPDDGPLLTRMRYLAAEVYAAVEHAELVVIEGLSLRSQGSATRDLAGLWWLMVEAVACRERLYLRRQVAVVAPPTLKLWATGSGRASKREVRDHICRRWRLTGRISCDEADALVLASMGLHHAGLLPWAPTPAQMRAIVTPRWDVEAG